MAYKAQITPLSGQASQSITLTLELDSQIQTRVRIENATHRILVDEFELAPGENKVTRQFDLKIPDHSSDSMISVFVGVETFENGKFNLTEVLPLVYNIEENLTVSNNKIIASPSFATQEDNCKIVIDGNMGERYVVSVNDKRLNIIVGPSGVGTINFKLKDVLMGDFESVAHKFPIYYYSEKDNFIKKNFSGSYIHVLPNDLKAAADADPRCDTYDPVTWEAPGWCEDVPPCDPATDPDCIVIIPEIPTNDLPKKICDLDDCDQRPCPCESETTPIDTNACRRHKSSTALLSNGMVANAYTSIDETVASTQEGFNSHKIYVQYDETSLEAQIAGAQNVAITSKIAIEDFTVYVTEGLYTSLIGVENRGNEVFAVFMDEKMNYEGFVVKEILEADEYNPFYTLIVDRGDSNIVLEQLETCIYSVFYERTSEGEILPPDIDIPSNISQLPFIETANSEGVFSATNVSISSNDSYRGIEGESLVHVVAEGYVYGKIQLFYYGFSVGPTGYTSTVSESWVRLTNEGSNKNAKIVTDKYNNLHVFWESDRTGLDQVYYGVVGPSSVFLTNAMISSVVDKKAELDAKEDKPFGYVSQDLVLPTGESLDRISQQGVIDEYTGIPSYPNKGIVQTTWIENEVENGTVTVSEVDDVSDITVTASALSDTALAFTQLNKDNFLDLSSGRLSQINYQVSFGFSGEVTSDVSGVRPLSQEDIDELYEDFKALYDETINTSIVNGMPFYIQGENRFSIGMEGEIYDRFIPIVGSYKNPDLSLYSEGNVIPNDFTIFASGQDGNLNHYFVAVVPEKVRFKAINLEDADSYFERIGTFDGYIEEEMIEYFTGRAAFAVIYRADNNLFSYELSNVTIRNISKPIILSEVTNIDIIANYSKMFNEDSARYLGVSNDISDSFVRFGCNLLLMVNGAPAFSESFVVDLSDKYRSFDIGFGVTSKGCFKADNFAPYNSSVFENADIIFNYTDVTISSPTYQFNTDVFNIPSYTREQSALSAYDFYGNEEDEGEKFFDNFNLFYEGDIIDPSTGLSTGYQPADPSVDEYGIYYDNMGISTQAGFDADVFMQIPLTLEGINTNPSIYLDYINNIYMTWQSNRDNSWNIFYSCSSDRNMPFRFDTQITDSESNSLSPDIAADIRGRRMIVWHDDRDGEFKTYSARALQSVISSSEVCENNGILQYVTEDAAQFVVLEFNFINCEGLNNGHFVAQFYGDNRLSQLIETVNSKLDQTGWSIDGIPMTSDGVIGSAEVRVQYRPNSKVSNICGALVYGKVTPTYK